MSLDYDINDLRKRALLDVNETAFIMRMSASTIRRWVSINGRTQQPYNPRFPQPVYRGRLRFRTNEVLAYQDGGTTFPSP